MNYILHLLIMIGIYLPLAYSLNLILGYGGLISFCHAAFYGIGAYTYAILVTSKIINPSAALFAAIFVTTVVSLIIGRIALRFRGDLFLFVTLGFQMIIFVIFYNWIGLTNGPYGLAGISRPGCFGIYLKTPIQYFILILIIDIILIPMIFILYRSSFGLTLKALRENEIAAESLGIEPVRIYYQSFVISAAIAAIPGAFYASYLTYIDPTSFTLNESIFQAAILLLGGTGNKSGPFVGVIIMILLPEALRFVGLPDSLAHHIREIIYGLLLALLMYFRPQGIAGEYRIAT